MSAISNRQDITEVLAAIEEETGIRAAYSHFTNGEGYPHIVYIGSGQQQQRADDTTIWRSNTYQVELYFKKKEPALEEAVEDAFLAGGWGYTKSDDSYLEDEGVFLIFYDLA